MKLKNFILLLAPILLFNFAYAAPSKDAQEPVKVQLFAENKSVQAGQPFWVGVELETEEGWDTYWINPGDSGFPTEVTWQLPEGFKAGDLQWPYPERFENDSLVGFGYKHSVLLLAEVTPPANIKDNTKIQIAADVSWLACKESCIPGSAHVSLDLPVTKTTPQIDEKLRAKFNEARQALPRTEGVATALLQNEEIILTFKPTLELFDKIQTVDFIPQVGNQFDHSTPQRMQKENGLITLHLKPTSQETLDQVKGVLLISEKEGQVSQAIQVNAPFEGLSTVGLTFGIALLFAFLGGMILNVMPCVLPVVVLKIFSFVKMAHEKRSLILKHGLMFALGVLISFWVLSGVLLILRAYGESIGWGFQLQEPVFVAILSTLLFLMGLSLFGVFEVGTSLISLGQRSSNTSSPIASSFMSGVLATLVATPCTGPLLGTALGFAMTLPSISALSIFTAMGLGMAAPYLLCSAFPKLVRFLPKPGNWLLVFKQFMGFLMMATVIWLVWVFGAQTDNMATFILLASFLLLAVGAWIFGKWATPLRRKATRVVATILSLVIIVFGSGAAIFTAKQHRALAASDVQEFGWEAFDMTKIEALRKEGTPVFVDYTAKWCLICQANKVTLRSASVQEAFHEKGVVTMTADWTKKDPRITEELQKLGRSGVPVYALYPGKPDLPPIILPQTLTSQTVIDSLQQLN